MVYLRTLGESVIEVGGARIGPSAPHLFAALLYLVLECGRCVPRARLQEILFPNSDDRRASHSLRQLLYRLRRMGVELESNAAGVRLAVDQVSADFDQLVSAKAGLREEIARIAAGFLPGFAPTFSRPFADWYEQRRAHVLSHIRRILTAALVDHRAAARWVAAEETARAMLALDPLNEEATLALAEALALGGSKVEAVQLLDTYLDEVGSQDRALRVPAAVLRRRIAERLPGVARAPALFVGRAEPFAQLRQLLGRARAGESMACHVWAEAGMGKTRLLSEFSCAATLEGACVAQVTSQPHDVRRPMGAFSDLVPALLRLPGSLGCSPAAIAFLRKLFECDADTNSVVSPTEREAELLSANITRAISELLDALAVESTMVLVVEDAQWLDDISLQVLADLIAERKHRPLLLVLTSRRPFPNPMAARVERLTTVRLEPLSGHECAALFRDLLRSSGLTPDPDLISWALSMAAGNPFVLQSLAAHYVATRDRTTIPRSLTILLSNRLDALDRRARHIFEACCVLGRHSTFERLESVLALPKYDMLDGFQALENAGLITVDGSRAIPAHELLSGIALGQAPLAVRTLLHRSAAQVLEATPLVEAGATVLWDCAEHWLQAGDPERSAKALRSCARHALGIGRPEGATDVLHQAEKIGARPADRIPVLQELLAAAEIAGEWPIVLQALHAIQRLERSAQTERYGYDLLELQALSSTGADRDELGQRLRAFVQDERRPRGERIRAGTLLAGIAEDAFCPDLAADAFAAVKSITGDAAPDVHVSVFDVVYHASFGDLRKAAEAAGVALRLAEHEDNPAAACRIQLAASYGLFRAGLLDEAQESLERCYHAAAATRLYSLQFRAAARIACGLRDQGRSIEAHHWHETTQALVSQRAFREGLGTYFSNCALFAMDALDFSSAREAIQRALSDIPMARRGHAGLHFRALALRVKQMEDGYDCTEVELEDLAGAHVAFRGFGHHDEVVETLWHALKRKGRSAEGDRLLDEYLSTYRRFRCPIPPGLQTIANGVKGPTGGRPYEARTTRAN